MGYLCMLGAIDPGICANDQIFYRVIFKALLKALIKLILRVNFHSQRV